MEAGLSSSMTPSKAAAFSQAVITAASSAAGAEKSKLDLADEYLYSGASKQLVPSNNTGTHSNHNNHSNHDNPDTSTGNANSAHANAHANVHANSVTVNSAGVKTGSGSLWNKYAGVVEPAMLEGTTAQLLLNQYVHALYALSIIYDLC